MLTVYSFHSSNLENSFEKFLLKILLEDLARWKGEKTKAIHNTLMSDDLEFGIKLFGLAELFNKNNKQSVNLSPSKMVFFRGEI